MSAFVYILELSNGAYYTGYTLDLDRRMAEHLSTTGKRGAKTTRSFRPVRLVLAWKTTDRSTAMRLEIAIKSLSRPQKEDLIASPRRLRGLFPSLTGVRLARKNRQF